MKIKYVGNKEGATDERIKRDKDTKKASAIKRRESDALSLKWGSINFKLF